MAMAPEVTETDGTDAHIAASYVDKDRLYLVFNVALDADLPPLPNDMTVIVRDERHNVISLDIQLQEDHSVVALLMEAPLPDDAAFTLRYRPTQWLMCDEENGDAIEAFDEELIPQSIELLDPSLRLKSDLTPTLQSQRVETKEVEATISSASEYLIQLSFNAALDSTIPIEITDFRAELDDRWLRITSAKYINSHRPNWPEIRLELSEPMETNERVRVGYRSPSNRLRTIEAETLASFDVETRVARTLGRHVSDDDSALDAVAISKRAVTSTESAPIGANNDSTSPSEAENKIESRPGLEKETHDPILDELDNIADTLDGALENEDDLIALDDIEQSAENEKEEAQQFREENNREENSTEAQARDSATAGARVDLEASQELEPPLESQKPEESKEAITEQASPLLDTANDTIVTPAVSADLAVEKSAEQPSEEKSPVAKNLASTIGDLEKNAGDADKPKVPTAAVVKKSRAETIAEKAARIQKALESKSEMPEPKAEPASLTARLIYIIPAVIFVWLLIVVFVYVSSIVFDLNFASPNPEPVVVLPAEKMPKETCSVKSKDGSSYEGECVNGKREGSGVYIWPTGNRYEGQWLAGKRHGKGILVFSGGGKYEGNFRAGVEEGRGRMEWPNGAVYEGEYRNGRFHGRGVYISADGSRFEGVFDQGSMTQNGECILPSGERKSGPCGQ